MVENTNASSSLVEGVSRIPGTGVVVDAPGPKNTSTETIVDKSHKTGGEAMHQITCAYCNGKGVDPFRLLSKLSTCPVCSGEGTLTIPDNTSQCPFCAGSGKDPHHRLTCPVCWGKGVVTIPENPLKCPECRGTGKTAGNNLPCIICGGTGIVTVKK